MRDKFMVLLATKSDAELSALRERCSEHVNRFARHGAVKLEVEGQEYWCMREWIDEEITRRA